MYCLQLFCYVAVILKFCQSWYRHTVAQRACFLMKSKLRLEIEKNDRMYSVNAQCKCIPPLLFMFMSYFISLSINVDTDHFIFLFYFELKGSHWKTHLFCVYCITLIWPSRYSLPESLTVQTTPLIRTFSKKKNNNLKMINIRQLLLLI